jgi:isoleucyl-tRNA synthetase
MKRTSGVFDCWFESGSMPYAQWHYPFENKDLVEKTFPADFIAEGLDQTRGWFYTLHVLSTALTINDIGLGKNSPAFKNVIVNGLILDEKGRKLSKKLKNYPDPKDVFDKYGADALRFFLLSSTAIGEDYRFSEDRVKEVWRKVISSIENCLAFYETYKKECKEIGSSNILDKWIVSRTEKLNNEIIELMNEYELTKASRLFYDYIDDLSNWYIRRSRKRFQKEEEASATLKYCLLKLSKLIAPFSPFIAEETYLKIDNSEESVHLCDYPVANKENINENLEKEMQEGRDIVNIVLSERSKNNIKVRQPLLCVKIKKHIDSEILELIKEEINVKEVIIDDNITTEAELNLEITPELKEEGMIRDIVRHIQQMRKEQGFVPKDRIIVHYENSGFFDMILSKNKDRILNDVLGIEFKKEDVIDNGKEILIEGSKIILKISKK